MFCCMPYDHNECAACGRVALGPPKLRAAAQGIHICFLFLFPGKVSGGPAHGLIARSLGWIS